MRRLLKLAALLGVAAAVLLLLAGPARANDEQETVTQPCDNPDTDCGDFPTPEEIPAGTPCQIYYGGEWLQGVTNDQGQ